LTPAISACWLGSRSAAAPRAGRAYGAKCPREEKGRHWDRRVDELMKVCKIDRTAKMARLLTEVRKQGEVIEAWADGES
jgi:hypothetical protein